MNEIAELKFNVDFKPSEISLKNEKELKALIDEVTNHYSSMVFTDDNVPEAKKARADLNKIANLIDEKRKEVKNQFTEPLSVFEATMNEYKGQVIETSEMINKAVKTYESEEEKKRLEKIEQKVAKLKEKYGIESDVEIEKSWTNKTAFTKTGNPTKGTVAAITEKIEIIKADEDRRKGDFKIIENYARVMELDAESWLALVDFGQSAPDVMKQMDDAVKQRDEKKQREGAAEKESYSTDEIEISEANYNFDEEPVLLTTVLKITGTLEQFQGFNRYLVKHGIRVEEVKAK